MACWRRLHLQFRHRWTSGRTSKSSNGRKIARMARNSTIFGPNESSRRDLFLEKFSKERNNRKVFEKLRKIFEKKFENFFERCNLMGDVILSNTSLLIIITLGELKRLHHHYIRLAVVPLPLPFLRKK